MTHLALRLKLYFGTFSQHHLSLESLVFITSILQVNTIENGDNLTPYGENKSKWWWFIRANLSRTTLGSINSKSSFGQFQTRICLAHSQVKGHVHVFFLDLYFFPTLYIYNYIFNIIFLQLSLNSIESKSNYLIEFSWIGIKIPFKVFESIHLNLNSIELNWISIQFNLHAMSFNISIQMDFNSHKTHLFHQLINWSSLVVHRNVKPK